MIRHPKVASQEQNGFPGLLAYAFRLPLLQQTIQQHLINEPASEGAFGNTKARDGGFKLVNQQVCYVSKARAYSTNANGNFCGSWTCVINFVLPENTFKSPVSYRQNTRAKMQ